MTTRNILSLKPSFIVFFALFVAYPSIIMATDICGVLYMPTTLTKAKSPYRITGDLLVPAASRLSIEAGVEVIIASKLTCSEKGPQRDWSDSQFIAIKIDGAFYVKGTPEAPVSIHPESHAPGKILWDGIRIRNQEPTSAKVSFLSITGANKAIQIERSVFPIENSFFVDNNIGIWLGELANVSITNSLMALNSSAGVYVEHAAPSLVNNLIVQNPAYGIWADSRKGLKVENNLFWDNSDADCFHCAADIGKRSATNSKGDSTDKHLNIFADPVFIDSPSALKRKHLDPNTKTEKSAVVDTNLHKVHAKADSLGKAGLTPKPTFVVQGLGAWRLSQYSPALDAAPDGEEFQDANGTNGDLGPWGATAKYKKK